MDLDKAHLSFSGAGFLGFYHLGVAKAFEEYFPEILQRCFVGTSAGALTAAGLCCSVPMSVMLTESLRLIEIVRSHSMGLLNRSFNLRSHLRKSLDRLLPDDAHLRCKNRLYISVTQWRRGLNELVCEFESKDDLAEALTCSSHIPVFCGIVPIKYRGKFYWDGGVSNNCPRLNHNTITVCPYSSPCFDICPPVDKEEAGRIMYAGGHHFYLSADNVLRCHRAFYPSDVSDAKRLIQAGYDNAIQYMLRQGIIKEAMRQISEDSLEEKADESGCESGRSSPQASADIGDDTRPIRAARGSFTTLHMAAKISAKLSSSLQPRESNSAAGILFKSHAWMLCEASRRILSFFGYQVGAETGQDTNTDTPSAPPFSEVQRHKALSDMMTVIDDFNQVRSMAET